MKVDLFGDSTPETDDEILAGIGDLSLSPVVLVAFSGGNDSRALAIVAKTWAQRHGIDLRLAAIRTGLQMDGWESSVLAFARLAGLPVEFYTGQGRAYYTEFVEQFGWPGNAKHSQIQTRLKGRAFRRMKKHYGTGLVVLSGIRKAESIRRSRLVSPYSTREGGRFVNPLFNWPDSRVYDCLDANGLPYAPGRQWDCKCGATAEDPAGEWAEIERVAPELHGYLCSLQNPAPWQWGQYNPKTHLVVRQLDAGQMSMFDDDGSLEAFPVCVACWRDKAARAEQAANDWG